MVVDVLPRWERMLYWICGMGGMFYSIYSLYREGRDNIGLLDTQPGITLLGGIKDASDPEWVNYLTQFQSLVPLLIGHLFIGEILFTLQLQLWIQKYLRLLYDVVAIAYIFGVRATLLCFVESLILYLVTYQRHTFIVWVVALSFTTTLNIEWIADKQLTAVHYDDWNESVAFFISISYVHLRLISASIEIIKHKNGFEKGFSSNESSSNKKEHLKNSDDVKESLHKEGKFIHPVSKASIVDFMCYVFYLPIFFTGPTLTFDEVLPHLTTRGHTYDIKMITKKAFKIVIWIGAVEIQSHFLYINSVQENWEFVRTLSIPSVVGLCVWQGQYFHLKYLCMFGIGSLFSMLDGVTPPQLPACISWVYSFSDMWKYFDVGLYNFIKRYVYIPCGGSKAGFPRQILGTVLAFAFVFYWHGAESNVFVWCFGNFTIIVLEMSAVRLEYSKFGSHMKSILGPCAVQRLRGLLAAPMYLASALQVMYFFFSMETGHAIVDKLFWETVASWKNLLLEYVGFYLAIQNAMYARVRVIGKWKNG